MKRVIYLILCYCQQRSSNANRDVLTGKYVVGIILGYKYLDGFAKTAVGNYTVKKNSLEIGVRISWWASAIIN
mgnify:FL=1